MKWKGRRLLAMALTGILLAGCGAAGQVDDYATNEGSTQEASTKTTGTESDFKGQDQGRGFALIGSGRRQWIYLYT